MEFLTIGLVGRIAESAAIAICRSSGDVRVARAPGMDWRIMPGGSLKARVAELLDELSKLFEMKQYELVSATRKLVVAVAGIDDRFSLGLFEQSLLGLGFDPETIRMSSVAESSHMAAFLGRPGLLIRCGHGVSGYIQVGEQPGKLVGGWGNIAGDRGSGPWIGRKAIATVTEVIDGNSSLGRGRFASCLASGRPLISLLEKVENAHYAKGEIGVRKHLYNLGISTIRLAEQGDQWAQSIVLRSWEQVLLTVKPSIDNTGTDVVELCFRGSLVEDHPYYCRGLANHLTMNSLSLQMCSDGCLGCYSTIIGAGLISMGLEKQSDIESTARDLVRRLRREDGDFQKRKHCCVSHEGVLIAGDCD